MSVIKISELDALNEAVAASDFFPLVNSSSMTTYRVDMTAINVWMAASGSCLSASNALTASNGSASYAQSASVAVSASYALSASNAVSASWAPQPTIPTTVSSATSASYASRSFNSISASFANNVMLQGTRGYVPYFSGSADWIYGGQNSGLSYSSPIEITRSNFGLSGLVWYGGEGGGIVGVSQYALNNATYSMTQLGTTLRPDVTQSYWFNPQAHTPDGNGIFGLYGLSSFGPIIAPFIGTDQIQYKIATASAAVPFTNLVWSGSSASGSYKTIGSGNGEISQSFNGKWIRIAAQSLWGGGIIAPNSARYESSQGNNGGGVGFFGRIRIVCQTDIEPASNVNQQIDMHINDQLYNGNVSARVDYAGVYSADIIKKIRITSHQAYSSSADYYPGTVYSKDPIMAIDLFIDDLNMYDNRLIIGCYSWGGVKFLRELNLEPPELINTGSKGTYTPSEASYLIFPPEPGYYSTQDRLDRNYNLHGLPVSICPTRNVRTGSAANNLQFRNPYSLDVSGSIHADSYYVTSASVQVVGFSGKIRAYITSSSTLKTMTFVNGILTGFV